MPKKGKDIGSTILVAVVILISVSVAGINLLTMFGIITADMLTYAVFVGLILIPTVIIGGAINKIVIEQKKALENLLGQPSGVGDKLELKINLKKYETTMADITIHPAFYFKIAVASMLSVLTGFFILLVTVEGIRGDILTIYPMLIPLIGAISVIHIFSKNLFEPNGWQEFVEHTWIAFFTISVSISFMISLKGYVQSAYPKTLWETFLGLPFSLQTLMYFVILLLLGGILVRLGDMLHLDSSPFKASGITLILVSMVFLIPQFQFIPLDYFHEIITSAFSILLIFYGIVTAALLYKDAGLRYIVTNEKVIKLNTNKLEKSVNYPLSRFKEIGVVQGILAKRFGYGNVNIIFSKVIKGRKRVNFCVLHGVKKPHLLANTIKALAEQKRQKKRPKKKISERKKIRKKKKPKNESNDGFYYKVLIIILCGSFLMAIPTHTFGDQITEDSLHVEEFHEIVFENLTHVQMDSEYNIYLMNIDDENYNATEIRVLYQEDEQRAEEALIDHTSSFIVEAVESSFDLEGDVAKGDYEYEVSINEDSLQLDETGPIVVSSQVEVTLFPDHYQIPEDADLRELAYGALKIGGQLEIDIPLFCEPNHISSYTIHAPPELNFIDEEESKEVVNMELDNRHGQTPTKNNTLIIEHQDPIQLTDTEPDLSLMIDIYELEREVDREYISINTNFSAELHEFSIPSEVLTNLPEPLELRHINADMLRLLYENGFKSEIDSYISDIESEINYRISTFATAPPNSEFSIIGMDERYGTEYMDSQTPLMVYHNSTFQKNLSDRSQQNALDIQRRYLVDEKVSFEIQSFRDWGLNYTVKVPEGLELVDAKISGRELDVLEDDSGRYYIKDRVPKDTSATFTLTVGTYIDIYSFLPFVIIIAILFFTWIGLNMYPVKKKRKKLI
ncbi:MAG: hypothetical protein ACOC53_06970 [Candidatus Saliniplasma sp.]